MNARSGGTVPRVEIDWRVTDEQTERWQLLMHRNPTAEVRVRELDDTEVVLLVETRGNHLAVLPDGTVARDRT